MSDYMVSGTGSRATPTVPGDVPKILRPGVSHREADYHGAAHQLYVSPEHPERAAKGDLGMDVIADFGSRWSKTTEDLPFTLAVLR